jgi:hypothetical protein
VFIQVIQGQCRDEDRLHRQFDAWGEQLQGGASGFLGGTYGLTDDGEFVGVVRFASKEDAMRNSGRPEQDAWWQETRSCFEGDPTFHDCNDVALMLDGGSDDAGFVQVIQGRVSDPEKFRSMMSEPMDALHEARPEIIGATIAIDDDGFFTETVAFTTEAEARDHEAMERPGEIADQMAEMDAMMQDVSYHDLHHPWFSSSAR